MPSGKDVPLTVQATNRVYSIMGQIQAKEGVRPKQQMLSFGVQELVDGRTLASYAIVDGSTVHLAPQ